ncbi:uncharacterized protein LOC6542655 [Drosophila erecta]|uniref:Uncharacterized protein n=1 Tax=Drosophila erecta TaxID=7220 RepID=B3N6P7_DROER|nr:uncharacterized protein LOC6542655 [Drosophila erecta]EDV59263.1 uncharacterized protein Dere_GG23502 [Drosophila erecta]
MADAFEKLGDFRKLQGPGRVDLRGIRISDRHNYFKNFDPLLKEAAFKVIHADGYKNSRQKASSLLSALKIKTSITALKSKSVEPLMCIELNCDFDVVLMAPESQIYNEVIKYFTDMLV